MQNRAYYVTLGIQRWLAVRLDLSANILILGISLFGAGFRETIDPSKVALVLTYTLSGEPWSCFIFKRTPFDTVALLESRLVVQ